MSSLDPFSSRFEVFGREARHVVPGINGRAFERLVERLTPELGADGRVVLLKAPRAGYGKTLLIQRAVGALALDHHFVKLSLIGGRTIEASHVLECLLESLCQVLPAADGLTTLDLAARRIIARGLEPLVRSGEVPCQDRDGALRALQESPVETFDFHHESAVTAHWTEANFEILGPRLAAEMARVSGASLREAAYWVELLFRFATTSPENVERSRLLFETVFRPEGLRPAESGAGERLHGLLSLIGVATRLVLVIDDTEGLSTHPPDALELASFVTNLAQTCPGTLVLLSVNDDVWETAFAPRLPGGLVDRLTEHQVALAPLSREEAETIVSERGGQDASEVLSRMTWTEGDLYARGVLKEAASAWEAWKEERRAEETAKPAVDDTFGTLDDLATLEKKSDAKELSEAAPADKVEDGDDEEEEGADLPSLSAAAAALAAAGGAKAKASAAVEEVVEEVLDAAIETDDEGSGFEASAYATPLTPLTELEPEGDEEGSESAGLSNLAHPSEPLAGSLETLEEPSEAASEEPPAASSPFAPVEPEPPSVFAPVEPEVVTDEALDDERQDPFSAGGETSSTPEESKDGEVEEATAEQSASPSPFASIWEDKEEAIDLKDDEDVAESSGDEESAPSPFEALAPPEPEVTEADPHDAGEQAPVAENGVPSPFEPFSAPEPEVKEPEVKEPEVEEPEVKEEAELRSEPSPSPFTPAAAPTDAEPEPPSTSVAPAANSPFQPVTPGPASASSSPFAPVEPPKAPESESPPRGEESVTGSSEAAAPADPFAGEKKEEKEINLDSTPTPFSPVGEGGLPPKRGEESPFAPRRDVSSSPFESAAPAAEVPEKPLSSPPEDAPPPKAEEQPKVESPFTPVQEPSGPKANSTPFSPVDRGSSAGAGSQEDEDKVDELLRQFKERYGRE